MISMRQAGVLFVLLLSLVKITHSQNVAGDDLIAAIFPVYSRSEVDPKRCFPKLNFPGLLMLEEFIFSVKKVNQDKAVLKNSTIGYNLRDYCDSESIALKVTMAFYDADDVSAVIAHGSFKNKFSKSLAGILSNRNPQIPLVVSSPESESSEKNDLEMFKVTPTRSRLMQEMISILKHYKWDYVAVISMDNEDGSTKLKSFQVALSKEYICIAQMFYMNSSEDTKTAVDGINSITTNKTVNVVVLLTPAEISYNITVHAALQKLDVVWLTTGESWDMNVVNPLTQLQYFGGLIYVGLEPPATRKEFDHYLENIDPQQHQRLANPWFTSESKDPLLAISYKHNGIMTDAVYAIAHALEARNNDTACDAKSLGDYLQKVDFEAPSGRQFSFTGDGSLRYTQHAIYNLQKKGYVKIGYVSYSHDKGVSLEMFDEAKKLRWGVSGKRSNVPISRCSAPCEPGWYVVTDPESSLKCCFNCMKCPFGEETKVQNARSCDVILWKQLQALITYGIVSGYIIIILCLIIIFCKLPSAYEIRYSSNATIHLLCSLLLTVLLPVVLFLPVEGVYCDVYNGAYTLCLGIPIAILISQSKCVRDRVYKRKSEAENACVCDPQPAIYISLLFISLVIAGIFIFYFPSEAVTINDSGMLVKECSSHSNRIFYILFFYVICLGSILFLVSVNSLKRDMGDYDTVSVCCCALFFFILSFCYLYARNNLQGSYKIISLVAINFMHAVNFLVTIFIPKLCKLRCHELDHRPKISFLSPYELSHAQDKVSERLSNTLPRDSLSPILPQKVIVHNGSLQEKGETTCF